MATNAIFNCGLTPIARGGRGKGRDGDKEREGDRDKGEGRERGDIGER